MYSKLQYISQGFTAKEQIENIQRTLDAGCEWVQLRFKNGDNKEYHDLAEHIKKICMAYRATFIINDHVSIAKSIDADGVHLGLLDTSIAEARAILGHDKIIGGTANTIADVLARINDGCDYIGLGPYRFTSTKEKLSPVLGIDGIGKIMKEVLLQEKNIPVYAIGGITRDDISSVMDTGVFGVAISGEITNNANSKEWIQKFNLLINEQFNYIR
jgi:thiamine-phosphate pyrophosphorylase